MSVNYELSKTIFIAYIKVDVKIKFIRRVKGFIYLKQKTIFGSKLQTFKMVPMLIRATNY